MWRRIQSLWTALTYEPADIGYVFVEDYLPDDWPDWKWVEIYDWRVDGL